MSISDAEEYRAQAQGRDYGLRPGEYITPNDSKFAKEVREKWAAGGLVSSTPHQAKPQEVTLSDEDRELLKQILQAVQHLRPKEDVQRLSEPAGKKSDYGLAS